MFELVGPSVRTASSAIYALNLLRQRRNETGFLDVNWVKSFRMQVDGNYYEAYWLLKWGLGRV